MAFTTWNGTPLEDLNEYEPLKAGERVLITFKWLIDGEWFRAAQWALLEKKLEGRKDWRVVSYRNEGDFLYAEIEVLQAPSSEPARQQASLAPLALVAVMVVSICAVMSIAYLSRYGQQRLVASGKLAQPVSAVGEISQGLHILSYVALIGVGGYIVLRLFRR